MSELWKSFSVTPDYVLGHSVGEFAAAVCCGALTFEQGLKLVVERSRLVSKLSSGSMLALSCNKAVGEDLIKKFELLGNNGYIDVAAVNSKEEIVLAGDVHTLKLFKKFCKEVNVRARLLAAKHAFHSRAMDKILQEYGRIVGNVLKSTNGATLSCGFISSVYARKMNLNVEYWQSHIRECVNFAKAFEFLQAEEEISLFLEIGPMPMPMVWNSRFFLVSV